MPNNSTSKYPAVNKMDNKQRISVVKEIFATATKRYDFLNHFLSMRRDIAWRKFTTKKMHFFDTNRLLDLATGTADLAITSALKHPDIKVIGIDFVQEMLDFSRPKLHDEPLKSQIKLIRGDGTILPFPNNSFDIASIAFGIRNIPDREHALKEMLRVVVPGGQVMILEMTFTKNKLIKKLFYYYLNKLLPTLAKPFSPNPKAYHYLADSIMNFPDPDEFAQTMKNVGIVNIEMYSLTLGITYLHVGYKKK